MGSLPLAGPLCFAGAAAVCLIDRVNPMFCQERLGRHGPFMVYKLCTMPGENSATPSMGHNDERRSRVGRLLSAARIDETPQLVQVAIGQMSLVGPRPITLPEHDMLREELGPRVYKHLEAVLREVRPGIVDPAIIEWYRSGCNTTDKAALIADHALRYAREASLRGDHRIILAAAHLALSGFAPAEDKTVEDLAYEYATYTDLVPDETTS
jgi:lipopolysaccharide/colanic/teichoic acid biosynthesis glycosyltransferase